MAPVEARDEHVGRTSLSVDQTEALKGSGVASSLTCVEHDVPKGVVSLDGSFLFIGLFAELTAPSV